MALEHLQVVFEFQEYLDKPSKMICIYFASLLEVDHQQHLWKQIELLKKNQTVHRGAVSIDDAGDQPPKVKRNKYKSFLRAYQDIPGTQTLPVDVPMPIQVTEYISDSDDEDNISLGLDNFADNLDNIDFD